MSASRGALARPPTNGDPRILALVAALLSVSVLTVGVASADPPIGVSKLSADDAERAGSTIQLKQRVVGASTLVEVGSREPALVLLAISPDGSQAAMTDQLAEASGSLILALGDGSQLRIRLPGILGAAFAADAAWLAVVDARGALWRVDAGSGRSDLLADGPFIGSPIVAGDGSLLLLAVPSVEAPYRSRLVRLAPATGIATPVSDDELVYQAFPLDDGALAIVAHEPGHTVVRHLTSGDEALIGDLGPGAINAAVAPDGRRLAFEREGEGIFLIDAPGSAPRRISTGSRPCFDADGSVLLVHRESESMVLAPNGSILAVAGELAGFAGSTGCLS
jgi:hypothetical protein